MAGTEGSSSPRPGSLGGCSAPDSPTAAAGAYPQPQHYGLLSKCNIRTVVNLLDQLPDEWVCCRRAAGAGVHGGCCCRRYKDFLQHQHIRYLHCPIKGNKVTPEDMSRTAVNSVLRALVDPQLRPILVHCRSGKHRTGAVMGCLRVLQGWSADEAWREYAAFAGAKAREVDRGFIAAYQPAALLAAAPPLTAHLATANAVGRAFPLPGASGDASSVPPLSAAAPPPPSVLAAGLPLSLSLSLGGAEDAPQVAPARLPPE